MPAKNAALHESSSRPLNQAAAAQRRQQCQRQVPRQDRPLSHMAILTKSTMQCCLLADMCKPCCGSLILTNCLPLTRCQATQAFQLTTSNTPATLPPKPTVYLPAQQLHSEPHNLGHW